MSDNLAIVLFTLVIVLGVVGGSVAKLVFKEVLPLLRTIAQDRQRGAVPPDAGLGDRCAALEARLDRIEADQRLLAEQGEFLQRLLDERPQRPVQTRAGGGNGEQH